jgi:hypothetical protein
MNFQEIIAELRSRGERDMHFHEDGHVTSWHGTTLNFWIVDDKQLFCYDCRTVNI